MTHPPLLRRLLTWIRLRFLRRDVSRQITDELRFHLAQRTSEYERAGLEPREARRRALRRFGNVDRVIDSCHQARGVAPRREHFMDGIWQDLRVGVRTLARAPGFAAVAILTLALGIGANTAVFTVLNSVLLTPLPYDEPERLVRMYTAYDRFPDARSVLSGPDFVDYRKEVDAFDALAVMYTYRERGLDITGTDGTPRRIRALPISSGYFEVYRARPALGRTFRQDEELEAARVAVLSHRLWLEHTEADPEVVGTSVTMNGEAYTVVGIMPPTFLDVIAGDVDVWIPQDLHPEGFFNSRVNTYLTGIGRLAAGVNLPQAQAQLDVVAANLKEQYPETNEERFVRVLPMFDEVVGPSKAMLFILMGAAGLVLLIACVNVANLFLVRSVARQREFALRAALGAGPLRVARQLFLEGFVLASIGGIAGLVVTFTGVRVLLAISPESLARANEVSFDTTLLAFTVTLTLMTTVLFGIAPAWQSVRVELNDTLRDSTRSTTGGLRGRHLRGALVASQVSLAIVLLVGAGLLMKSFLSLLHADLGIRPENVMTFEVHLPEARYADPEDRIRFHQTYQERLRTLPGANAVGASSWLPVAGGYHGWGMAWHVPEQEEPGRRSAQNRVIEGDYFEALGIPLLQGRKFLASDRVDAQAVVIISKSAAELAFPEGDPLGKELGAAGQWRIVVGVVGDVAVDHRGTMLPTVYMPHTEFGHNRNWALTYAVATAGGPGRFIAAARRELAVIDGDLVAYHPRPMDTAMGRQVAQDRFALTLMLVFGGVALTLAGIGIYGVLSYTVSQRTQEIGIRMALGARASQVRRIVASQGTAMSAMGIGVGIAAAFGLSRLLDAMMFQVSVRDPIVFTAVPMLLGVVSFVAGYLPARRATRVDPIDALRRE